ncbi:MAG TPA: hypothetical protein VNT42_10070 [Sphingomonas sp.]|nr:hypothetical protein [Sphingomonas sp.]
MTAGYSNTPLSAKLGMTPGARTWRDGMPATVAAEIGNTGSVLLDAPAAPIDVAHIFVTQRERLDEHLAALRPLLAPSGFIWVSWPKKAAKLPTDITEDSIRDACFPLGLVDVKVCAVDAVWSGLKLMIRRSER